MTKAQAKILIVDDEEGLRDTFRELLVQEGYSVKTAEDFESAVALLSAVVFDLVFTDIVLGEQTGIDLLREIKRRKLSCPVIMITGYPNVDTAAEAVRLGAFDYIPKPVRQHALIQLTRLALAHQALVTERAESRAYLETIFRSVQDGIVTVDDDLVVRGMNDAAARICGFESDHVIGKRFSMLNLACDGACVELLRQTLKSRKPGELQRFECRRVSMGGTVVSIRSAPLEDPENLVSGAVLVVRDETRLAVLEDDLATRRQMGGMVGKSQTMQEVYSLIRTLALVDTAVLITGETGTGKELVAEALHHEGDRRKRFLVKVNCTALTDTLLESELFGHIKGAFTGAIRNQEGRFKRADGGTIFLDEIGDISPALQVKLLRVLQEKEFERVGESIPTRVDVRVIAATNSDLREKVRAGAFREDLFFRLKVFEIRLPSLRERREDIPLLVDHFLRRFNRDLNRQIVGLKPEVEELLMRSDWPGNVRELEHVLEHCCVLCRDSVVGVEHLPRDFVEMAHDNSRRGVFGQGLTHQALRDALVQTDWNKAKAGRKLGVSRMTIYRKMKEFNLDEP